MTDELEPVKVECNDCGQTVETDPRNKMYFTNGDAECNACIHQNAIESLRKCLDPDHDGTFSRPDALQRLRQEFGQTQIVDYDGGLIQSFEVKHGRGIGAEPNGYWIESIAKIIECPECEYERAEYSFKANAGHHRMRFIECAKCGHTVEDC